MAIGQVVTIPFSLLRRFGKI